MAKKKTKETDKEPTGPVAPKPKKCAHSRCKAPPSSDGFCRLHYLLHWKELKSEKKDKAEKRLNSYIDRLMKKYPGEYMEKIRASLESEEKFKEAMQEMEESGGDSESDREFLEKFSRIIKVED